ncbi:LysE family translocator [Endozoicomonas sp. SCSIO W0465]|uniref:LysE family translocator n=1 Tax=Endozoicomonas sp. SCSIO W0465 TaxID=2918516 RepID=UPI0020762021|nr:LysE family translocator [Endozoicomonas sp. SCSIO W0465]USE36260.1 LysE family translocator [Endozoicomonas sp. SCSIO W0465]
MSESSLALFLIATLILALAPGPDLLYITTRGFSQGAMAGFISALGVHTGVLIHTIIASLGLSALITSSTMGFACIKYAGAAYLCYLGVRTLFFSKGESSNECISKVALKRIFYQGVITDVLNPKVILFFLAFFPQFIDPSSPSASIDILMLGLMFVAVAFPIDAAVGLFAGSIGKHHCKQRIQWGKWMAGSAFILLGIGTAFTSPPG